MLAVYYKTIESVYFQFSCQSALNEALSQNVKDRQNEVKMSNKYLQYHEEFVDILSKIQIMCDGCLGPVNVARDRIEFCENVQLVYSALYRAG